MKKNTAKKLPTLSKARTGIDGLDEITAGQESVQANAVQRNYDAMSQRRGAAKADNGQKSGIE